MSNYYWEKLGPCKSSRSEAKGRCHQDQIYFAPIWAFPDVTKRWLPNDARSLKWHKLGAQFISRSSVKFHSHIAKFTLMSTLWTITPVKIHWWLWDIPQSCKGHVDGTRLFFNVIRLSSMPNCKKMANLTSTVASVDYDWSSDSQMAMEWCNRAWRGIEEVPYCQGRPPNLLLTRATQLPIWLRF